MSAVQLIVFMDKQKMSYELPSHAEAVKLSRGMFDGYKCKIVDKKQRSYPRSMRSYVDLMWNGA